MAEDLPPPYSPPIMANDSAVLRAWACWIRWQVKMPVNLPPQLASMADDTDAHHALARWIFDVYGEGGMGGFDGGMGGKGALDGGMGKGGMGAFDGGKGKGGMGGLGALDGGMGGKGEKGDVLDDGSGATVAGMGGSSDGGKTARQSLTARHGGADLSCRTPSRRATVAFYMRRAKGELRKRPRRTLVARLLRSFFWQIRPRSFCARSTGRFRQPSCWKGFWARSTRLCQCTCRRAWARPGRRLRRCPRIR